MSTEQLDRLIFTYLRRAIRRLYRRDGLARILLVVVAWFLVTLLLDYLLHLPWALRAISLAALVAGLVHLARRHLRFPLSRQISDDDLALVLERHHPQLRDRLISAVQLERQLPAMEFPETRAMALQVIQRAREDASRLDHEAVLAPGRVNRRAWLGALSLGVAVVVWCVIPGLCGLWASRNLLLRTTPWPQRVYLEITQPRDPGDPERSTFTRSRGDDVDVLVEATEEGEIPHSVWIHYTSESMGRWVKQGMSSTTARPRTFSFTFPNVREDFSFLVTGEDATTRTIEIHTLVPPSIHSPSVFLDYPDYTGLPDEEHQGGDVRAPVGTQVTFRAQASKPIRKGLLAVGSQEALLAVTEDQLQLEAAYLVQASTTCVISLTSVDGLEEERAAVYQVTARPDMPPRVRVEEPGRKLVATPTAVIALEGSATDDYGVDRITLRMTTASSMTPGPDEPQLQELQLPLPAPSATGAGDGSTPPVDPRDLRFEYQLSLVEVQAGGEAPRPVAPGDRVRYQVAALDRGAGQEGLSPVYEIDVVTVAQLERELTKQVRDLHERLKRTRQEVERTEDALTELTEEEPTAARITAVDSRQGKITRDLGWVGARLQEVLQARLRNQVARPQEVTDLEAMLQQLSGAGELSRQVEERLRQTLQTRAATGRRDALEEARGLEGTLRGELDQLLDRLRKYEDFQTIVNTARDIRDRHEQLLEETRKLAIPEDEDAPDED